MGNEVKKPMNLCKALDLQIGKPQILDPPLICFPLSTVAFLLQHAEEKKNTSKKHTLCHITR